MMNPLKVNETLQTRAMNGYNYKQIDFASLRCDTPHCGAGFFDAQGVTFEDRVGDQYLTGNELLYYPELAQKLREVNAYPYLKQTYSVNEELKGPAFLAYFYHHLHEVYERFQTELTAVSTEVNQLIVRYSEQRQMPIIDHLDEETMASLIRRDQLMINGVLWSLKNPDKVLNVTEYIDLYQLFNFSRRLVMSIYLEDAIPGTSFIALRLCSPVNCTGRVHWFSLETGLRVFRPVLAKKK